MPIEFVDCAEARARSGLRLVVVGGVPSPWGEAAKGILHVKGIPYVAVRLTPGDGDIPAWTGCDNAPVAIYEGEKPRSGWAEILLLAERLAPQPRLIPQDPAERALLFGLAHEICGELGLGWCRRLVGVHQSLDDGDEAAFPRPIARYLGDKYGYRPGGGPAVRRRVLELLGMLAARLHAQRAEGSPFYLGRELTAVDLYAATFMALFAPLPPEQCPMPAMLRAAFEVLDADTEKALDPILVEHRDAIYRDHLELPLAL